MAATGDWITPRLWGQPWFEKPALLYWMTAAGFKLGLGPDLAPRLPVALASVAFLIYFFFVLRREFGERAAWYSATILATSAGWLAYSHVAITDLPMSAAFAAAMLAILARAREPGASSRRWIIAGAMLGLAVLAKGLVPLVLFIPALWFLRRQIRDLALLFGAAIVIAAPWYVLVTLRNGRPFLEEFFWKHHFSRFLASALQHGQPFWFYIPVLLAGLFPWTPLFALLFQRRFYDDRRAQFLLAWLAWGFLFFSDLAQQAPRLPAAAAASRSRADGDGACGHGTRANLVARLRLPAVPGAGVGRNAPAGAGWRNLSRVVPSGLALGVGGAGGRDRVRGVESSGSPRFRSRDGGARDHGRGDRHRLARLSGAGSPGVGQASRINHLRAADQPIPAL